MNLFTPQILKELFNAPDFFSYAQPFLEEEKAILGIKSRAFEGENLDFFKMDLQKSVFENSSFRSCNFEKASFVDILFKSCEFSNSNFAAAYFERCLFVDCKCIGLDMRETTIKQSTFEKSNFQFSSFDRASFREILFEQVDFSQVSISEAKLKKFRARNSKFVQNNFFRTLLATVDFTENDFRSPKVSAPALELKGAIISPLQAADLVGIWGVIVQG